MPDFVWVVVIAVNAFGYSGTIVPDEPKFRVAYEAERDCRKAIPAVRRAVPIPQVATASAVCRKMEVRK